MRISEDVKNILENTLNLGERKNTLNASSILLGNIPELDSMAVINIISALEHHFGIEVCDDELNAETFETLGSLVAFVNRKLSQ